MEKKIAFCQRRHTKKMALFERLIFPRFSDRRYQSHKTIVSLGKNEDYRIVDAETLILFGKSTGDMLIFRKKSTSHSISLGLCDKNYQK